MRAVSFFCLLCFFHSCPLAAAGEARAIQLLLPGTDRPFAPRKATLEELKAWYGDRLDPKDLEAKAAQIPQAEALIEGVLGIREESRRAPLERELLALGLSPGLLRGLLRHGWRSGWGAFEKGYGRTEIPSWAPKAQPLPLFVWVPEEYTPVRPWPVIVALHGMMGTGDGHITHWLASGGECRKKYLILAPTADPDFGWGPSDLGRKQVWAALDWLGSFYRIDTDRVYLEGISMGGAGVKRLATIWPDRVAAISPRSGPPMPPQQWALYQNLLHVGVYSLAGGNDPMIRRVHLENEKSEWQRMKVDAVAEILSGRGHEVFEDYDEKVLAFFGGRTRFRAPDRLTFASCEEGEGNRHYFIEILESDSTGNVRSSQNVLNNRGGQNPIVRQMQETRDPNQYQALQKKALENGAILEVRPVWMKSRQVILRVDRKENALIVESSAFVRRLRIYLDEDVMDMDREVIVRTPIGVQQRMKPSRSPKYLLDHARASGRRDLTFWGHLDISLP